MKNEKNTTETRTDTEVLIDELSNMSASEYRVFVKGMQFDAIKDLLDTMKNLKNTDASVWEGVIRKLKSLRGLKVNDPSGLDFNKLLDVLLPLVGKFAATTLTLKAVEKSLSENSEGVTAELDSIQTALIENAPDSVVMGMCRNKENGFSDENK